MGLGSENLGAHTVFVRHAVILSQTESRDLGSKVLDFVKFSRNVLVSYVCRDIIALVCFGGYASILPSTTLLVVV